jgi:hypothetical protein
MPARVKTKGERRNERYMADQYIANVSAGMARTEAAKDAGFIGRKARQPFKLIEGNELRRRMQRAAWKRGNPLDVLAETVLDAMQAEKAEERPDENGKPRLEIVADHRTRNQAAKTMADLIGVTAPASSMSVATQVVINMPASASEWFK